MCFFPNRINKSFPKTDRQSIWVASSGSAVCITIGKALLQGKGQYDWPPCTNQLISTFFQWKHLFPFLLNNLIEEVYCTADPSPSERFLDNNRLMIPSLRVRIQVPLAPGENGAREKDFEPLWQSVPTDRPTSVYAKITAKEFPQTDRQAKMCLNDKRVANITDFLGIWGFFGIYITNHKRERERERER